MKVFNVTDYGATGRGKEDDTEIIQQTIGEAANWTAKTIAGNKTGGIVWFPAGSYRISRSLLIPRSNVVLAGVGRGSSEIFTDRQITLIQSDHLAVDNQPDLRLNCGFQDLSLRVAAATGTGAVGIDLTGFSHSYVNRVALLLNDGPAKAPFKATKRMSREIKQRSIR